MDESSAFAEFNAAVTAMNTAFNRCLVERDALTRMGSDPTAIDLTAYRHNLVFLNRIAALEPVARQLEASGSPRLNQSLRAQKADIEKACQIILEMAKARRATNAAIMAKGFKDYQEVVATLQRINDGTREAYGLKKKS